MKVCWILWCICHTVIWLFHSYLSSFLPTALETLVDNRITGFPVIDNDWKLVSLFFYVLTCVSNYKLIKQVYNIGCCIFLGFRNMQLFKAFRSMYLTLGRIDVLALQLPVFNGNLWFSEFVLYSCLDFLCCCRLDLFQIMTCWHWIQYLVNQSFYT